ncbi:MAG TPA: nodulation protein NfeD [Vicinamibacterales bacterium]|nr:nodulation protein NfeD [Vicinamibacterales bacterium]
MGAVLRIVVYLAAMVLALAGRAAVEVEAQAAQGTAAPVVYAADVDGIIHPVTAEFMLETLERANREGAVLVVFTLRTPGGLVDSTRAIVSGMLASKAPVAVHVAPGGARAASAGFILVLAADIAAMAQGTHIGAAHPVNVGGGNGGDRRASESMEKKAASDVAAYARSLAERRGRNVALAAEAVTESRAFTDVEALEAEPPLIDLVASNTDDLVRKVDGRTIKRFDGREATLETTGARIVRVEMTRRQRLLSAIAHPQIAYLLFTLGVLGLTVELWNPGAVLPGVVGGLCLLLAFFAFQVLPIDATGLILVAFGIALIIAELTTPSFGVLGIGGAIGLVVGSLMLTDDVPGVVPNRTLIVALALAIAGVMLFLGRLAIRSQRQPPATGPEAMVGQRGRALTAIAPGETGQVAVRGEIWAAVSTVPIPNGAPVVVTALDGLIVTVAPESSTTSGGV